jgi:hypothetical protein
VIVSRSAVQTCQEDDDDDSVVLSSEERQKVLEAKQSQIRQIVGKCSTSVGLVSDFQTPTISGWFACNCAQQREVSEDSSSLRLKTHHSNQDFFSLMFIAWILKLAHTQSVNSTGKFIPSQYLLILS